MTSDYDDALSRYQQDFPDSVLRSVISKITVEAFAAGIEKDTERYADLNRALWIVTRALTQLGHSDVGVKYMDVPKRESLPF